MRTFNDSPYALCLRLSDKRIVVKIKDTQEGFNAIEWPKMILTTIDPNMEVVVMEGPLRPVQH